MHSYEQITSFLPPSMRGRAMEYFSYGEDLLDLLAGTARTQNITIQNDADFLVASATARVEDAADPTVVFADPAIQVAVRDTSSGQNFENVPVPFGGFFSVTGLAAGGAAGLSGMVPFPRIIKAGGTIRTTFSNLTSGASAQDFTVRYVYRGFKVYYFEAGV